MSENRGMNELKTLVLTYLKDHGSGSILDVSHALGEEYHNVANALRRCRRSQLLESEKVKGGPRNIARKVYTIRPQGIARLEWYRSKDQEEKPLPESLGELARISKEPAKHKEMRTWKAPESNIDIDIKKRKRKAKE